MRYDDPVVTTANGGLGHGQEHLGKSSNILWMEEILHQWIGGLPHDNPLFTVFHRYLIVPNWWKISSIQHTTGLIILLYSAEVALCNVNVLMYSNVFVGPWFLMSCGTPSFTACHVSVSTGPRWPSCWWSLTVSRETPGVTDASACQALCVPWPWIGHGIMGGSKTV